MGQAGHKRDVIYEWGKNIFENQKTNKQKDERTEYRKKSQYNIKRILKIKKMPLKGNNCNN